MKYRCRCDDCRDSRKIRALVGSLNRRGAALVSKLQDRLIHAEMDAEYYRMKYRGTWPEDIPLPPAVLISMDARDWTPGGAE